MPSSETVSSADRYDAVSNATFVNQLTANSLGGDIHLVKDVKSHASLRRASFGVSGWKLNSKRTPSLNPFAASI